jgi:hypothetical protein
MSKSFTSALLAMVACAQSRLGENIKMVIVLSNGGVEYPPHNFGLSTDAAINSIHAPNELTPLGQRQQYLIGTELRVRYVDESLTMLPDYYVPQTFL